MIKRPALFRKFIYAIAFAALFVSRSELRVVAQSTEPKWDSLFQRERGWLGADGVYSLDLGFDSSASEQKSEKTSRLFWFSDTFVGATKNGGLEFDRRKMINHSFAILSGDSPNPENIEFYCQKDPSSSKVENIVEGHYWLQDGVRLGNKIWISAILVGQSWKPDRIDAVTIPIDPETLLPDFNNVKVDANSPLSIKRDDAQLVWGAAICDDCPDEYVYTFGYVDRLRRVGRKDMVVSRVRRDRFEEYGEWEFFDGKSWSTDPEAVFDENAALAFGVSTEYSVSRIPYGTERGKYLLVYTPGVIGEKVAFRVGETPAGPFGEERVFYRSNVPKELPGVKCYNAKAHPIFSDEEGILVSYNVNRLGDLAHTPQEYRPRFIRLRWETISVQRSYRNKSGN